MFFRQNLQILSKCGPLKTLCNQCGPPWFVGSPSLTRDVEAEAGSGSGGSYLNEILMLYESDDLNESGSAKNMPLPLPHHSKKHTVNNILDVTGIFHSIY